MSPARRRVRDRSRRRGAAAALVVGLAVGWLIPPCAADPAPAPRAGGRLIWDLGDALDLLGDLWVELPFPLPREHGGFVRVDSRTSISRTASDFTFLVRDLDYDLQVGWSGAAPFAEATRLRVFAGQRGKERVDAAGQPWIRYLGAGLAGQPRGRFRWDLAGGLVVDEREVEADGTVEGGLHLALGRRSGARLAPGVDLRVRGLVAGGRWNVDVIGGPRIDVRVQGDRTASVFAHYQRSRDPLGIGESALLVGFEYREGTEVAAVAGGAPEIDGRIALGGGAGRIAGGLALRFLSPAFGPELRGVIDVDGNILTADDTGELYYLYHVGLERPTRAGIAGGYFFHRSNHQLAEPNDTVTSVNVLEVGLETPRWTRPGRRPANLGPVAVDARARVGFLLDSSFGEDRRWHARGGARITLPMAYGRPAPFCAVELERGDVERTTVGLGVALLGDLDVQLEYRSDEQFFGSDRTALVGLARYGF